MMKASSLSSALVVRKGSAAPSSATPSFKKHGGAPVSASKITAFGQRKATAAAPQSYARDAAVVPEVTRLATMPQPMAQQRPDRDPLATTPSPRPARGAGGGGGRRSAAKVRMTLRLEAADHLRLKLAAAHTGKNMTALIEEAIDGYLEAMGPRVNGGHCACIAGDFGRPGKDNGES